MDIEKEFGVDPGALRSWEADAEGNVLFGEDYAYIRYARPDCEVVPQKENALQTGTWYGRDKDKSTVLAIRVSSGKIDGIEIIEGESSGDAYAGGLAAYPLRGLVKNCASLVNVTARGDEATISMQGPGKSQLPEKVSIQEQRMRHSRSIRQKIPSRQRVRP